MSIPKAMTTLRQDANEIVESAIRAALPDEAVRRALRDAEKPAGQIVMVAAGKAAWRMARAAAPILQPDAGIVITKYDHVEGEIPGVKKSSW